MMIIKKDILVFGCLTNDWNVTFHSIFRCSSHLMLRSALATESILRLFVLIDNQIFSRHFSCRSSTLSISALIILILTQYSVRNYKSNSKFIKKQKIFVVTYLSTKHSLVVVVEGEVKRINSQKNI